MDSNRLATGNDPFRSREEPVLPVPQVNSPLPLTVFDAQPTLDNAHVKCKDRCVELCSGR